MSARARRILSRLAVGGRIGAALAGLAYLATKVVASFSEGGLDFRLIWLAGKLWDVGADPYSQDFALRYAEHFGAGPDTHFWSYPPYWQPICVALAQWSFPIARGVWAALNASLVVVACAVAATAFPQPSRRVRWLRVADAIAFASFMQATPIDLSLGQTAILPLLGSALVLRGFARDEVAALAAGGALLLMKPNFGLVVLAGFFVKRSLRWPLGLSTGVVALLGVPLAVSGELFTQGQGFGRMLARYGDFAANQPANLTGLTQLADSFGAPAPAMFAILLVAAALAAAVGHFALTGSEGRRAGGVAAILSIALFFVPLHSYDIITLALIVPMARFGGTASRALIALGLAICFRPGNVAALLSLERAESLVFPESLLVSVGLFAVLSGALLALVLRAPAVADPVARFVLTPQPAA